uniref:Photosystem II reaction center protein Z n=1 Tax=Euglena clara TaxID=215708 RepID=A0A2Z4YVK1_9EUGL|nr:photosystem II protein Z [Euglena clara]AXA45501.1 photosystem II protein Z [Euglena clara]
MLLLTFQLSLLALVIFSFLMVVAVPVVFASNNGWDNNKNVLLFGAATWTILVLIVGTLNYLVI